LDVITNRFPCMDQVVGVRIVDKSFSGKENFRLEIWLKYDRDDSEEAKKIRTFIEQEYGSKNVYSQAIAFKDHKAY
jgi:hypothetical protein